MLVWLFKRHVTVISKFPRKQLLSLVMGGLILSARFKYIPRSSHHFVAKQIASGQKSRRKEEVYSSFSVSLSSSSSQ